MPLTSSLYVHGTLTNTKDVLVDIGTGYFVEKVATLFSFHSVLQLLSSYLSEHECCQGLSESTRDRHPRKGRRDRRKDRIEAQKPSATADGVAG